MKKPSPPSLHKGSMHIVPLNSVVKKRPQRITDENPATIKTEAVRRAQADQRPSSSSRADQSRKNNFLDRSTGRRASGILSNVLNEFSNPPDPAMLAALSNSESGLLRHQPLANQAEKRENIKQEQSGLEEGAGPSQDEINSAITALLNEMNVKGEARAKSIAEYFNFLTGKKLDVLPLQEEVIIADDVPRWSGAKSSGISPREFIETAYKDYLGKGLTQADIRKHDKELYRDLHNWLRKKEHTLDGLELPTKAEARRKQLEGKSPEQLRALRGLANSAAYLR